MDVGVSQWSAERQAIEYLRTSAACSRTGTSIFTWKVSYCGLKENTRVGEFNDDQRSKPAFCAPNVNYMGNNCN